MTLHNVFDFMLVAASVMAIIAIVKLTFPDEPSESLDRVVGSWRNWALVGRGVLGGFAIIVILAAVVTIFS